MANTNSNNSVIISYKCVISCNKCFLIDNFFLKQKDKKHPVQASYSHTNLNPSLDSAQYPLSQLDSIIQVLFYQVFKIFGSHTQREGVSLEERRWGRTTREMSRKGALTWNSCDGRACRPPKTSAPGGRVSGRRRRCCWECSAWLPQPLQCLSARTGSASTCDRGRCSQEGGQGGDIRGRGKMESNGGGGRSYTESGFEDVDCSFCLASYIYLVILFLEFKWKHNLID